jgi:hypothetical protein
VEPGLYLTFFSDGESVANELPPVGPLDQIVLRDGSLLADRKDVHQGDHFGAGNKWLEAELELQRAIGTEPGGRRRSNMRIAAPDGVYMRFVAFGGAGEHDPVPELGPFAVVVVGNDGIEADGDLIARRAGPNRSVWELTGVGVSALAGVTRPDIALRTRSTVYHPLVKPLRPGASAQAAAVAAVPAQARVTTAPAQPAAPAAMPAPAPPPVASPPPAATRAAPEEATATLRDRIGDEPRTRFAGTRAADEGSSFEIGSAAWRLRYLIIGTLVALLAVLSIPSIINLVSPGATGTYTVVGLTKDVTGPRWTYSVTAAKRLERIGVATPRGVYLIVQLAVTNRGSNGAQLFPSGFSIVDAAGNSYVPLPSTSGVSTNSQNVSSSYIWASSYPVGRAVGTPLIFDINPSARGLMLVIDAVPSTRIRLD